jgi:hypothetical protein
MLKPTLALQVALVAAVASSFACASSPKVATSADYPADAQTPQIAGQWTFAGCEEGIVWDAHHFDMVEEGLICKWRGHDERGRSAERTESFAADGSRIKSEQTTLEWQRTGAPG